MGIRVFCWRASRPEHLTQRLAAVLGYAPDLVVLGVNILDDDKSAAVLDAFDLADD